MTASRQTGIVALKRTLLIVEDDQAVRDSMRMVLEIYGYSVEVFGTGEDFMAQADLSADCCVILDVNLPGASGLGVLEQLRSRGCLVPAVIVSALSTDEIRARAKRLNALAFFDKPVNVDCLISAINAVEN
ncbi:response regulator [Thalassobaculum sp.]|uniref:response regulator transcription factor n=1 Tax=Thalassobaculum sp. TaxID=2022740 RepID=UPI0032EBDB55